MRLKTWIAILIPILIVVGLVGWRFAKAHEDQLALQGGPGGKAPAGAPGGGRGGGPPLVEVIKAGPKTIRAGISAVATAESPLKVSISPKSAGRIEFLQAREGDKVTAGEVLVKIDPSDLQGAVAQQEANVAEARSRLAQAKLTQNSTDVGIKSQIRQQQAALTSAQANLDEVQRNYDSQVATAQAAVTDAQSKVVAAQAGVRNQQAVVDRESASLRNAQTKYDRTQNLYKQGFLAAQDLDDAKTALDVQQKTVAVAQAGLDSSRAAVNSAQAQLASAQSQASITARKGKSDIEVAKAGLAQAKAQFDVATANQAQNPAYRENIAALQSEVSAAQAQLDQAQSKLADTTLRSPIDGYVTARNADPGTLASPGSPVLEVQQLDWLYIVASVPVDEVGNLSVGKSATITIDALPGKTFSAPITQINPAANNASRNVEFQVKLANQNHAVKPGMFGQVSIQTGTVQAAIALPHEAVNTVDGRSTVATVDADGVAHLVDVTLGASDDSAVQILTGVNVGDAVVTSPYQPIREGQKVKIDTGAKGADTGGAKRSHARSRS